MESFANQIRATDRVFVMSRMDDKIPKDYYGLADPRLITGGNKLHAIKDPETCLWYFKYEDGGVPERLKCKFTGFKDARKYAEMYFNARNIKITEVID